MFINNFWSVFASRGAQVTRHYLGKTIRSRSAHSLYTDIITYCHKSPLPSSSSASPELSLFSFYFFFEYDDDLILFNDLIISSFPFLVIFPLNLRRLLFSLRCVPFTIIIFNVLISFVLLLLSCFLFLRIITLLHCARVTITDLLVLLISVPRLALSLS